MFDPSEPRDNEGRWSRIGLALKAHNDSKRAAFKLAADTAALGAGAMLLYGRVQSTRALASLAIRNAPKMKGAAHTIFKAAGTILRKG